MLPGCLQGRCVCPLRAPLTIYYHNAVCPACAMPQVLDLLSRVLAALGNSDHDMAKGFLDVAVRLLQVGVHLPASLSCLEPG